MTGLVWIAGIWGVALCGTYLLRLRGRRPLPLSPALALAIVLLLLGVESTSQGEAANALNLNALIRGALASTALVFAVRVLLVNGAEGRIRTGRRTNLLLVTTYVAFAVLSTLYSIAPLQTAGKAYELFVGCMVIWAVATTEGARQQLRAAIDLVILLWSAMLLVAMPLFFILPSSFTLIDESRRGFVFALTMAAPYAHSNTLSAVGATVTAYALARGLAATVRSARRAWFLLASAASLGIVLASGRQGVVIWAVSVCMLLLLYARPLFVLMVIPATTYALYRWSGLLFDTLTRDQDATLYTLSSRLIFWQSAIDVWKESPLFGYGFGAGGRFVALPSIGQSSVDNLHNGYLEALVGVGIVGLAPLLIALVRLARWSWYRMRIGVEPQLAILVVPLALHTAISLGFGAWLSSQFLVFGMLVAYADLDPIAHTRIPPAPPVQTAMTERRRASAPASP